MAGTRDIKRKISSVKNTQKITKAMKMVSAAKMRRAQDAMESAKPFAKKIGEMVDNVSKRTNPELHPFLAERDGNGPVCLIAVTSDKGLCGAFNSNVIKAAQRFVEKYQGREIKVICIGKKTFEFFKRKEHEILDKHIDLAGKVLFSDAKNIAEVAMDNYLNEKVDEVHLLYNEFRSTALQVPVTEKLLPLGVEESKEEEQLVEYIYEPKPEMLLNELMPRYIRFKIFSALLESVAGEHGARMMAMDNASRNASEMIGKLTLTYNKARQAAITNEILDIVNGAEALNG
ncbi:ATP synthase F1 subunit gamma [Limisalsivibrio acetivorans]|uniref:ATP synthase F1 subunit gamma n=1 Tax=Limisalsivibrio acetivorans TaxID=1304888 RepID=UPI0003B37201|nr:ATP synthase F1 subunit gamma [Limisalsivibrio acetivorans]